ADWLAVDLPNMRSLLHVYKMEHHHQNSHPPRTTTRNEVTMYIHHILRKYRTPQVGKIGNHFWYWKCRQCEQLQFAANWEPAYQQATHHARNHHYEPMMTTKTLNASFFDVNHNMMTLMFGIEEY